MIQRNNMTVEQLVADCMKNSPKWGASECAYWAPSKRRHHPATALIGFGGRPAVKDLFAKITVPTLILKADASRKPGYKFDLDAHQALGLLQHGADVFQAQAGGVGGQHRARARMRIDAAEDLLLGGEFLEHRFDNEVRRGQRRPVRRRREPRLGGRVRGAFKFIRLWISAIISWRRNRRREETSPWRG